MTNIQISPKKVALIMSAIILMLMMVGILGQYYKFFIGDDPFLLKIVDKLDLDGESNNLPNWYQSSTLLLSSFILTIIALLKRAEKNADFRYWGILAVIFMYLSLDELVSIHEQATLPLRQAFELNGYFYLSWVIPGAIVVLIFFFAFLKFLQRLEPRTRYFFIAAGAVYVFGALGLEMIDAKYLQQHEAQISGIKMAGEIAFNYALLTAAEEFFEMAGIMIFIYTLLSYLQPSIEHSRAVSPQAVKVSRSKIGMVEPVIAQLKMK